tara:strand:+ start:1786 stop:2433 length:648 start_codon:yes stop_codon:yes gene_type:complete
VPKKNIAPINNKPLISFTIEAAIQSEAFSDIIVSTDDLDIKKVAENHGASVPFIRPANLATDNALAIPTIQHSVKFMEDKKKCFYDIIVMLQPTTPLREPKDINRSLNMLINSNADSVISVVNVDNYHPMKMKVFDKELLIDYSSPPVENPPRQSLPDIYIVNGAIYATRRNILMNQNSFKGNKSLGYKMPIERSVNIDNHIDLKLANVMIKNDA